MAKKSSDPGLCLIAEARAGADWQARISAALEQTGALTLILTGRDVEPIDVAVARPLVELAQNRKVAAVIANDIAAAKATGADGVHLSWRPEIEDAYEAARNMLGPDAIVGADAGLSRHDAMSLGEAGADYVGFSPTTEDSAADEAREIQRELVTWWAEIFVVPVVAIGATSASEVTELARAGADFIAVRLPDEFPGEPTERKWAEDIVAALSASASAA